MKTKIYNWIPTCLDFRDLIDDDHSHLTAMLIMLQNRNEQSTKYFIFVWFWEMLDNIVSWGVTLCDPKVVISFDGSWLYSNKLLLLTAPDNKSNIFTQNMAVF